MITAGSVRGNWPLPQRAHTSSWPAARGCRRPPQRGQNRVDEQPLGEAERVEDQRRARASAVVGQVRQQPAQRRPTRPSSAGGLLGAGDHGEPRRGRPAPRAAPAAPRGPPAGATQSIRRRAAAPGCRRRPAPGCPGRPTAPRARRRRVRRTPVRSWGLAASARAGVTRSRLVRGLAATVGDALASSAVSTHIGAAARRHRPHRPAARRPAAGEVDRGDVPRRRHAATARCAACSASPAPGAATASRCRAPAWASRRWRSTPTSCSASTTCSRSSGSAPAAR